MPPHRPACPRRSTARHSPSVWRVHAGDDWTDALPCALFRDARGNDPQQSRSHQPCLMEGVGIADRDPHRCHDDADIGRLVRVRSAGLPSRGVRVRRRHHLRRAGRVQDDGEGALAREPLVERVAAKVLQHEGLEALEALEV